MSPARVAGAGQGNLYSRRMPTYQAPGVFIEETSFRAKSIEGVPTSVAGFVGACRSGPTTGVPALLTSLAAFERLHGDGQPLAFDDGPVTNFLWHAVRCFFEQGGTRLHVARVFRPLADGSDGRARGAAGDLSLAARHPGVAGNASVRVGLKLQAPRPAWAGVMAGDVMWLAGGATPVLGASDLPWGTAWQDAEGRWHVGSAAPAAADVQPLVLSVELLAADGRVVASWQGLSPNPARGTFSLQGDTTVPVVVGTDAADGLALVRALAAGLDFQTSPADLAAWRQRFEQGVSVTATLVGGNDGQAPDVPVVAGHDDPPAGLQALAAVDDVSIVAAPGAAWWAQDAQAIAAALIAHAERQRYRVAVLDAPPARSLSQVRDFRRGLDSSHAALYHPWIQVVDPLGGPLLSLPPSGAIAGVYARSDVGRGVFRAPANEVLHGVAGFECDINTAQQEVLNPEGINVLREFEGRGRRVWGARTISTDPEWKYVNVRRYFAYLERSLDRGTQWAVFEPNGDALWAQLRAAVGDFLYNEWRHGALLGVKPEEAYFVRCDRSTMTQNDLDNGRLVVLIGVAPLKPAEFVIFRIGQWTADRQA